MNRRISTERVYSLGNYQTLRLVDEVNDIPDELLLNAKFIDDLRRLQFINLDLMYRKYLILIKKLSEFNQEDAIGFLLETRENINDEITNQQES